MTSTGHRGTVEPDWPC